jgi:hypothetical protein
MHKNATKCNKTLSKWCKNKHGASKIIDTFETYQDRHTCNTYILNVNCLIVVGNLGQALLEHVVFVSNIVHELGYV